MLAEIGLVGKGPGKYNIYLGGNRAGTRVPKLYLENVGEDVYLPALDTLIGQWAKERLDGECFGDFTIRTGIVAEVKVSKTDFYA
jgi:sulfite reductase (NADPH) hemoprotein beta-component